MQSLALLIPIALIFVTIAIYLFYWAINHDQFDDLEGPAYSILFDDDTLEPSSSKQNSTRKTP